MIRNGNVKANRAAQLGGVLTRLFLLMDIHCVFLSVPGMAAWSVVDQIHQLQFVYIPCQDVLERCLTLLADVCCNLRFLTSLHTRSIGLNSAVNTIQLLVISLNTRFTDLNSAINTIQLPLLLRGLLKIDVLLTTLFVRLFPLEWP